MLMISQWSLVLSTRAEDMCTSSRHTAAECTDARVSSSAVAVQPPPPLTCAAASTRACCSCVLSPPMSRLLCVLLNSALMSLMEVSPDQGAAEPVPKPVPIPCSRQHTCDLIIKSDGIWQGLVAFLLATER
jgi:hypothetical protein